MLFLSGPILLTTSPFIKAHILRVHSINTYYFSAFYKKDPALITDVTQHTACVEESIPARGNSSCENTQAGEKHGRLEDERENSVAWAAGRAGESQRSRQGLVV